MPTSSGSRPFASSALRFSLLLFISGDYLIGIPVLIEILPEWFSWTLDRCDLLRHERWQHHYPCFYFAVS